MDGTLLPSRQHYPTVSCWHMRGMPAGIASCDPNQVGILSGKKTICLTLYAEFRYLLTLNEVLLEHFPLIFIIEEA